jgi:aspartyl-tRNA(Asn)/glutamyl-tRNA(Gln) amidotransferase subunit A
MQIDLQNLTIKKTHEHFINGDFTVRELVDEFLKKIEEKNTNINAYIEVYKDIEEQIKKAEEIFMKGEDTLLTGIPVALKDNILFKDHIASASSKILENYHATYDSFVVQKLKEQGAIIIGRTNMDEFAMGSSTETSAYGPTKNPIDLTRVPGGSSGGAAAAVASEMALFALGTETCGSVRQPASFCGLVGLKPTYGAISRSGIIAMGSSLDQVGPLGKNVADVEIVFNSISKYDNLDSTSIPENERSKEDIKLKKVIGVPRDFLETGGIDKEVLKNFEESCQKLKENGYQIIDVSLPSLKYSLAVYYIIMPAEVSSNMARYDGIRYGLSHQDSAKLFDVYAKSRGQGFGSETRRRILLGTYILSKGYYDAYYNTALTVRQMIRNELEEVFKKIDVFMTPTVPFLPFKFGEKLDNPLAMYLCDIFSAPANLADIPAISIPSGRNEQGLPFGIQFTGPYLGESILFDIGKDFEKII